MRVCAKKTALIALIVVAASCVGCDDEQITVNIPEDGQINIVPEILSYGSSNEKIYCQSGDINGGPEIWVAVADANGLDDISAVLLHVGSVQINAVIARPDSGTHDNCTKLHYADMDTLNIMSLIPTSFPGVENVVMYHEEGGIYRSPDYALGYPGLLGGRIRDLSEAFGSSQSSCSESPWSYVEQFHIYPPAVSVAQEIFVTFLEVELADVSVTAYDAVGDSVTVALPNFRSLYTTELEDDFTP